MELNETLLYRLHQNDSSLVELNLSRHSSKLTKKDTQRLAEALKYNTCVKYLDISFNNIDAEALAELKSLTSLNVKYNYIGNEEAKALAKLQGLTTLDIQSNNIGAKGAKALAELKSLTTLDIQSNSIGTKGAKALAELKNLTKLNICSNSIGAEGAKALAELKNLTKLNIQSNKIGDEGAKALAELKSLTKLDIQSNNIGAEGAKALAELKSLTKLNIQSNKIGAEGAKALAERESFTNLNVTNIDLRRLKDTTEVENSRKRTASEAELSEFEPQIVKKLKSSAKNIFENINGLKYQSSNLSTLNADPVLASPNNYQDKKEQLEIEMEEMSDIDEKKLVPNKKHSAPNNKNQMSQDEKNEIGRLGEERAFAYFFNKYKDKYGTNPKPIEGDTIKGFKIVGINGKNEKKEITYNWENAEYNTTAPIDLIITTKRNGKDEKNRYVEVKGTKEKNKSIVTLSRNQLKAMKQYGNRFTLFRAYDIYNLENRMEDREIKDPYKKILLEPKLSQAVYSLQVKI